MYYELFTASSFDTVAKVETSFIFISKLFNETMMIAAKHAFYHKTKEVMFDYIVSIEQNTFGIGSSNEPIFRIAINKNTDETTPTN